jgi:hypothetical protein
MFSEYTWDVGRDSHEKKAIQKVNIHARDVSMKTVRNVYPICGMFRLSWGEQNTDEDHAETH